MYTFHGCAGTIEEKIIQRQLSKEGLQNIVDNRDQVNTFSTTELKALFTRREETKSDTHDAIRCKRCKNVTLTSTAASSANKHNFIDTQVELCAGFISGLVEYLQPFVSTVHEKAAQLRRDKAEVGVENGHVNNGCGDGETLDDGKK
jgi:hypothetical protein